MATGASVMAVVVGGAITSFLVILLVVLASVVRTARQSAEQARAKYPNARHLESGALFFGQQSRGAAQMRGNGTLVLTDADLVFEQWVMNRSFRIPYAAIVGTETPRSFLGKSQGVKILQVNFVNDAGEPDAMAWRVANLDTTLAALDAARGRS